MSYSKRGGRNTKGYSVKKKNGVAERGRGGVVSDTSKGVGNTPYVPLSLASVTVYPAIPSYRWRE